MDYDRRRRMLEELHAAVSAADDDRRALARDLVATKEDGRIKLYVTSQALHSRLDHPGLFTAGEYLPLAATGDKADHLFAFARRVGDSWADGLLTVNTDAAALRAVVEAFRGGGGAGKPMFLQAMVGYDPDEERAWQKALEHWPIATVDQDKLQDLETPEQFAAAIADVGVADLKGKLRISSDVGRHIAWIAGDLEMGFDAVYLYTIDGQPERFLDVFGEEVLPACGGG